MISEQRDKWIWLLARNWVVEDSYAVIQNEARGEEDKPKTLHLLKHVNREWYYIRISLVEYMWPQMIERDKAESTQLILQKRAQLNHRPIHALYLYVYDTTPPLPGRR